MGSSRPVSALVWEFLRYQILLGSVDKVKGFRSMCISLAGLVPVMIRSTLFQGHAVTERARLSTQRQQANQCVYTSLWVRFSPRVCACAGRSAEGRLKEAHCRDCRAPLRPTGEPLRASRQGPDSLSSAVWVACCDAQMLTGRSAPAPLRSMARAVDRKVFKTPHCSKLGLRTRGRAAAGAADGARGRLAGGRRGGGCGAHAEHAVERASHGGAPGARRAGPPPAQFHDLFPRPLIALGNFPRKAHVRQNNRCL